jgi:hypothetical protein
MRNINKFLTGFALVATMFASGQTLYATNINQEILELKMKYEDAYKRYTTAIKEGVSATTKDLAKQVEQAKAKYEEAKRRLTLSDETKKNIKEGVDTVTEKVTDTFAYGTGNTIDTSTDNRDGGKSLSYFDNYSVSINGNNYCGQFSTAMIFQYYGINKDGNKIYSETNPGGIFTAPSTLVEYLNLNGLDANEKNNASIQDLIKKLDNNTPVQCLVSTEDGTPHWVVICGYETDSNGNVTGFRMRDSYWGTRNTVVKSLDEFTKMWKDPMGTGFASNFVGYSNLMIDIKGTKTPDKSPSILNVNFSTATQDNIAGGINDVVTGFKNLRPSKLASGVTKCVLGIPGAVVGVAGTGLKSAGSKMVEWGKKEWTEGGVGDKIAGGLAVVGGYATQAAGSVAKVAGNALSSVANMAGNFFNKLGYVFR